MAHQNTMNSHVTQEQTTATYLGAFVFALCFSIFVTWKQLSSKSGVMKIFPWVIAIQAMFSFFALGFLPYFFSAAIFASLMQGMAPKMPLMIEQGVGVFLINSGVVFFCLLVSMALNGLLQLSRKMCFTSKTP